LDSEFLRDFLHLDTATRRGSTGATQQRCCNAPRANTRPAR
jgi:hypothetical protein